MKIVFGMLLSFLLLSCNEFILSSPEYVPQVSKSEPAESDAGFISFSGTRFEKYYWKMISSSYDKLVDAASPRVAASHGFGTSTGYNRITLYRVPLRVFYESFFLPQLHVTGTLAVVHDFPFGGDLAASAEFDRTTTLYLEGLADHSSNHAQTHEPYTVSNSFESASLALPKTGAYSNPATETKYKIYSIPVSADFLRARYPSNTISVSVDGTNFTVDIVSKHATNLTCTVETWEPYILSSRNFYQYKNFIVTYAPENPLSDFVPSAIVELYDYDPDSNSLTVILKDYDEPYSGAVISFKVLAANGGRVEKTVRIRN